MNYGLRSIGTWTAVVGSALTAGALWLVLDALLGLAPGDALRVSVATWFFAIGIPALIVGLVVRRMFPESSLRAG